MISQISKKTYNLQSNSVAGYKLEYSSSVDGCRDWAIVCPRENKTWIVNIHGHGAKGDQLFTHKPIRLAWFDLFLSTGCGIVCPDIRGNSWMCPLAATDLHDLHDLLRGEYDVHNFIFFSASMGGTSNLIYSVLYPQDVTACISLGAATDLSSYYQWCMCHKAASIQQQIARAIRYSYAAVPGRSPELFDQHSVLLNSEKLTMPVFFAHGQADIIIPVSQARQLAEKMQGNINFKYQEIPDGDHGSPVSIYESHDFLLKFA